MNQEGKSVVFLECRSCKKVLSQNIFSDPVPEIEAVEFRLEHKRHEKFKEVFVALGENFSEVEEESERLY